MKIKKVNYLLLISTLICGGSVLASGTSASMLAGNCAGCHGPNGVSNGPAIPTIAGMTEEYLNLSMQDYKAGTRASTVMTRIAKGYSDDEIKAMAKHFAAKKYVSLKQTTDKSLVAKGDELQQTYCRSCHEKNGAAADGIGVLAGQAMPYLDYTVTDFLSGTRPMERRKKQKMDQLVKEAGKEGFHAIIQYYGSK